MYVGNFAGGDFFPFFFSPVFVVSHYWFFLSGLACVTFCVAIGMKAVKFYIIKLPLKWAGFCLINKLFVAPYSAQAVFSCTTFILVLFLNKNIKAMKDDVDYEESLTTL